MLEYFFYICVCVQMNAYICMCVSDIIIQAELSQCCEGSKVKNILTVDCRTVSICVCVCGLHNRHIKAVNVC